MKKRQIEDWLSGFVQISTAVRGEEVEAAIVSGDAGLSMPADIFAYVKGKGVFMESCGNQFFPHRDGGNTFLIRATIEHSGAGNALQIKITGNGRNGRKGETGTV